MSYVRPRSERPSLSPAAAGGDPNFPVVDLSTPDADAEAVDEAVAASCREWGFFQVVNHGVRPELLPSARVAAACWEHGFFQEVNHGIRHLRRARACEAVAVVEAAFEAVAVAVAGRRGFFRLPAEELAMYSPSSSSGTSSLHNLLPEQELAVAPPHFITRSSGGDGRNGRGGPFCFVELQSQQLRQALLLPEYVLEAGGQAHRVRGGAAAPVQQPPEVSQRLDAVMVQALSAFLPACVTAYPLLKDAPDYIKFTIFGGLAVTTLGLFVGTLSNSVARRGLTIRLVSFSAIAVLTFCTASQFSSRIYVALTALIGVVLNLIIMLLRF